MPASNSEFLLAAWNLAPLGAFLAALLLIVFCVFAWALNLIALPGNWIAVLAVALYAWLGPVESRAGVGMACVVIAFGFALLGELFEFFAAAAGVQRAGASRRATFFAIVGSVGGALLGAVVALPIPVVGPVVGAVLFGGVGALAGAMFAEWTNGRPWKENWRIGQAAFWGRTIGTAGKMLAGLGVILTATISVCL